jgi:hypothetical protein
MQLQVVTSPVRPVRAAGSGTGRFRVRRVWRQRKQDADTAAR